jgi:tRNA A-37 threonylcarbamoyl transferase component Bud32
VALACRALLGEFPRPGVLLKNSLQHEAARLRFLGRAGCRVPGVWHSQADLLVLEHVGEPLPGLIRRGDESVQRELAGAAARDLADFHARGFWHGGAQLRNMTLRDGRLWRIDFEENIGEALSLPLAQAYDVFQALSSLLSLRKVPAERLPALGEFALRAYLQARPDPAVRAALCRVAGLMVKASRLLGRWGRRPSWRDVHAFFLLADTLRLVLLSDEHARRPPA